MKTGLIVYVPEHRDRLDDWVEPRVLALAPDQVRVATSDDELAYHWWTLIAGGVRKVECVRAAWDGVREAWSPQTQPMRLCG
mgnify:CR=1 FL=1